MSFSHRGWIANEIFRRVHPEGSTIGRSWTYSHVFCLLKSDQYQASSSGPKCRSLWTHVLSLECVRKNSLTMSLVKRFFWFIICLMFYFDLIYLILCYLYLNFSIKSPFLAVKRPNPILSFQSQVTQIRVHNHRRFWGVFLQRIDFPGQTINCCL